MKKLLIIFILIVPIQLLAQIEIESLKKGNTSGLMYLSKDCTVLINQGLIKILSERLTDIVSIGGKTTISIPINKEFKKRMRLRWVNGYLCQYAWTGNDITLQKPKTYYWEFDFEKKTIKKDKQANNDNDDPFKPSDTKLKDTVKSKDEKENKKPGTQIKPGK